MMRQLETMLQAEADIAAKLTDLPIDFLALAAVSNIWRASQLFRRDVEQRLLSGYKLTWASFSTLFIVWVWGPLEMGAIAESQAVGPSTITSTVSLLEKRGLCRRERTDDDRRSVFVTLTPAGEELIKEVFPAFNRHEQQFISALNDEEVAMLSTLLRKIVAQKTAEAAGNSE